MKEPLRVLFCLLALTGLLNCLLMEPVFAYQAEIAHSESSESHEDSDCCFTHCSSCHSWVAPAAHAVTHDSKPLTIFLSENVSFQPDSPIGLIFHPPSVR